MPSIYEIKELEQLDTPILLFECTGRSGEQHFWSTHEVTVDGVIYSSRVVSHDAFELKLASDGVSDGGSRISLVLANPDNVLPTITGQEAFRGLDLVVRAVFVDLSTNTSSDDARVLFRGICGGVSEINEKTIRLTFHNRLALLRSELPANKVQSRCPWQFPATLSQRQEGLNGGVRESYSSFFACGYSPDIVGGFGNNGLSGPFTACTGSRPECIDRGMFNLDIGGQSTKRFAGCATVGGNETVTPLVSQSVPLVYGTAWIQPPIAMQRTDGKAIHLQTILNEGPIQEVLSVVVDGYLVPEFHSPQVSEATGWYRLVNNGQRAGVFDPDASVADNLNSPYGSLAYLHIAFPAAIRSQSAKPSVRVLLKGLLLPQFDSDGISVGNFFTSNPAWIALDVIRRIGWLASEIDYDTVAATAAQFEELVSYETPTGETVFAPFGRINLVLDSPRSANEILRGIQSASKMYIRLSPGGKLAFSIEDSLERQHATKPDGSNSLVTLNDGWPAYEFGDGTGGVTGIARKGNGDPSIRFWSKDPSDIPNKMTLSFYDEDNYYQLDSLTVGDPEDIEKSGQELSTRSKAIGLANLGDALTCLRLQLAKNIRGNLFVEFETSVRAMHLSPGDIITITYSRQGVSRLPFRIIRILPDLNFGRAKITAQLHDDAWYSDRDSLRSSSQLQSSGGGGIARPILGNQLDGSGITSYGVSENNIVTSDGQGSILLGIGFLAPPSPSTAFSALPSLSLTPGVSATGGTIAANTTYYYGISAIDSSGNEGPLSAVSKVSTGATPSTYQITLQNIRLPAESSLFNVYRGLSPQRLLRIATGVTTSASFVDIGYSPIGAVPPDENFHHADFYWRQEILPPTSCNIHSSNSIGNSSLSVTTSDLIGHVVQIISGKGAGQERNIIGNTATTIFVKPAFGVIPDNTSTFLVASNNWQFGCSASASPAQFEVYNRAGSTVHVGARAISGSGKATPLELSDVTSYQLVGAFGIDGDSAPPPSPVFGLTTRNKGEITLLGVGFSTIVNTKSIASLTLTTYYWNELNSPTLLSLSGAINNVVTTVVIVGPDTLLVGDILQIENEILTVQTVLTSPNTYSVSRGSFGSTSASHSTGVPVMKLTRAVNVIPFQKGLVGSPALGSFRYTIELPDTRIAVATLTATNFFGTSLAHEECYTATLDAGIRTNSGGQYTMQIPGFQSIQTSAIPPIIIDASHSVRQIYAVVAEAPTGSSLQVRVMQDTTAYATLTIAAGDTLSDIVNGFGLPPLSVESQLLLDVIAVPSSSGDSPGRDLTVFIQL